MDIKCPQPTRPFLKRRASRLDLVDQTIYSQPARKQSRLLFSPIDPFPLPSLQRSRSDTFLARNMTSRPNPPDLFRPATVPLSPPDSRPRLSSTLTSFSSSPSRLDSRMSAGSRDSARVSSPSYRDELERHKVHIQEYGDIPTHIEGFARGIIQRERTSPGLSDNQVSQFRRDLSNYSNADEDTTKGFMKSSFLFPAPHDYHDQTHQIATGGNIPYDRAALPLAEDFHLRPIIQPKPDLHFGYSALSFTNSEFSVMQQPRLSPYAHPNTANYWPFFAVEFKSLSRGGTSWVAENQNAATGSHCVNSISTLLEYSGQIDLPKRDIQSIAFSCVVDYKYASLWVHWRERGRDGRFLMSELDSFRFQKPNDLRSFRSGVRSIVEYGLGDRLTTVKLALMDLFPEIESWKSEERSKKIRPWSVFNDDASQSENGS